MEDRVDICNIVKPAHVIRFGGKRQERFRVVKELLADVDSKLGQRRSHSSQSTWIYGTKNERLFFINCAKEKEVFVSSTSFY